MGVHYFHSSPQAIHEYLPEIPEALEQIVEKVLSKEPSARYRTADQLGRVLLKFGTQRETPPSLALTPEVSSTYQAESESEFETEAEPAVTPFEVDWLSVVLGLLALIAVGGLIPFWMWVYFVYNPPIR